MRIMTVARLVLGLLLAAASYSLGVKYPAFAWLAGWLGCTVYFQLVALPKGWDA